MSVMFIQGGHLNTRARPSRNTISGKEWRALAVSCWSSEESERGRVLASRRP